MTDRGPRVALIGAGFIGMAHSLALRQLEAWSGTPVTMQLLVDAYAPDLPDRARAWGWAASSPDPRSAFERDDVDLVVIATPNDTHHDLALAALRSDKQVVCEKPLATTLEEAQGMASEADARGATTSTCFVFRTWPAVEVARQRIARGDIGEPFGMTGRMVHGYALDPRHSLGWRGGAAAMGTGALHDIGSHIVDISRFLMGEVASVSAQLHNVVPERVDAGGSVYPSAIDDSAFLQLRYASGATGHIQASWAWAGASTDIAFTVQGSEGSVSFSWDLRDELRLGLRGGGVTTVPLNRDATGDAQFWEVPGLGTGYVAAFTSFYRRVLAGDGKTPTFDDGLRCLAVLDAARRSASDDGRLVRLAGAGVAPG